MPLPTLECHIKFPQHSPSPDVQVFYRNIYLVREIIAAAFAVYIHDFSENEM